MNVYLAIRRIEGGSVSTAARRAGSTVVLLHASTSSADRYSAITSLVVTMRLTNLDTDEYLLLRAHAGGAGRSQTRSAAMRR